MKYNSAVLIAALQQAILAADAIDAANPDNEDGGTCNFDSAYISVPGMRKAQGEEISAALAQYTVSFHDYHWHGRILMLNHGRGQANRRSRMATAAYRSLVSSLQGSGVEAGQYLQMD